MSRIVRGDPTWRLHDSIVDTDGIRWLFFRRWGVEYDYRVRADMFAGAPTGDSTR